MGKFFYVSLIATLPFFSIRPLFACLSATLLFLVAIALFVVVRGILNLGMKNIFSVFDLLIVFYSLIALFSAIYLGEIGFALLKIILYFVCYLALKVLLGSWSHGVLEKLTHLGVIIGTLLFVTAVICAVNYQNLRFTEFSYYGTTYRVFSSLFVIFGREESIRSVDIMRNSIGEVFSFYFVFILITNIRSRIGWLTLLATNLLFTIGMFSRRAFFAVMLTIFVSLRQRNLRVVLTTFLIGALVIVSIFLFNIVPSAGGRLVHFSDPARIAQYNQVIEMLSEQPLMGDGFGAKLNGEKYVHNFVLASFMMLGVPGLTVSLAIYLLVMWNYFREVVGISNSWYPFLLIIPLMGMTVGGTVEGMFTPVGWIILALCSVHRRNGVKCKASTI